MSSSKRNRLDTEAPDRCRRALLGWVPAAGLALAASGMAGCGYRPLYGRHGTDSPAVHESLAEISVGIIPNREGQILRNELIARLTPAGRPSQPRYRLSVSLTEAREDLGLTAIDTITRTNLILRAEFVLIEVDSEALITRDRTSATAGFEVLGDELVNLVSETDARNRALVLLAEEIRTQLALALADQARV